MKRAPEWTPEEFEILLQSPTLPVENLKLKLPRRTTSAIQIVRNGIHAYHTGMDTSMLSFMMVNRLKLNTIGLICSVCKMPLG